MWVSKGESLTRFAHFNSIYPDTAYEQDQSVRLHWMDIAGCDSISVEQLSQTFDKHNFTNYELIAGDITETVDAFVQKMVECKCHCLISTVILWSLLMHL